MNIIERRKIWFALSGAVIAIGLIIGLFSGINLGIDFTGGALMEIEVHQELPVSEIREIVNEFDPNANINLLGRDRTIVQIRSTIDFDNQERLEIFGKFQEKYDLDLKEDFLRAQQFGPAVGREIQNRALISVLISALGMLAYITFRFELRFGFAAITALIHDILIVIAVYSIFRIPINAPFVAAVLTILGYSINDTIVVFDRIRENLKFMKKNNYEQVANDSIKQTIVRSINTSVTTLITIVALYVLGVEQIRQFALPLIAGVVSGTYSSIFIASPVWVMLKEMQAKKTSYNPNPETK
ncbi:protein translocase subunit SecF [Alkaliphilus peptidifermentans]|uniref:Protein-export membrane protein SecF n=1 Tax=Alkaliphilus peptidifermentans DSM 18978 TaxID=1120976 RepID=A0A1G5L490_9FIRM|nr:protein translocase subunit SecF [Alkaliphilus peptidifermentans]SCZ07261.1 protein translocase subunit secF [Alkaliphilus peptidifermentans DSM 18978]